MCVRLCVYVRTCESVCSNKTLFRVIFFGLFTGWALNIDILSVALTEPVREVERAREKRAVQTAIQKHCNE